jgi:hypothetical protein
MEKEKWMRELETALVANVLELELSLQLDIPR